jgi:hypothetical protein
MLDYVVPRRGYKGQVGQVYGAWAKYTLWQFSFAERYGRPCRFCRRLWAGGLGGPCPAARRDMRASGLVLEGEGFEPAKVERRARRLDGGEGFEPAKVERRAPGAKARWREARVGEAT